MPARGGTVRRTVIAGLTAIGVVTLIGAMSVPAGAGGFEPGSAALTIEKEIEGPVPEGTEFLVSSGCQFNTTSFDGSVVMMDGKQFVCASAAACEGLEGINDPWTWAGACLRLRYGVPGEDILVVGTEPSCPRAEGEISDYTTI